MKIFIVVENEAFEGYTVDKVFKNYSDAEQYRLEKNAGYGKGLEDLQAFIREEVVHGS